MYNFVLMYYIVYALLYLLSLLPFFIWYPISSCVAFLLRKLKYRKEVILYNLRTAFPDKPEHHIQKIYKDFYLHFTDSMVEMLKMMSISRKELQKRGNIDVSNIEHHLASDRQVIIMASHLFGFEYGNSMTALKLSKPVKSVYMKLSNDVFDRVVKKLRTRTGAFMITASEFPKEAPGILKRKEVPGLIADQNPSYTEAAYWMYFFSKAVPFNSAPEKLAQRANAVVVFMHSTRIKRGYYKFTTTEITTDAASTSNGEITRTYREILQNSILQQPANYLWSHKRYKWTREQIREKRWMDTKPLPPSDMVEQTA